MSDAEAGEKAVEMFQKALKIDSTLAVANNAMKLTDANVWNWKAIEQTGPTHPGYDIYLMAAGRIEEKIESEKRRLALDPYAPFLNYTHCNTLNAARRYDEAIAQCRKTLNLVPASDRSYFGPESPWIHISLSNAYAHQGKFADSIDEAKSAVDLAEGSEAMLSMLGAVYAKAGQKGEALKILERLHEQIAKGEYVPALNVAGIYMNLGDRDRAFAWLNKAVDERESRLVNIKVGLDFDVMRDDPRFAGLLKRMNLPD
jgi:tetratricopeptide (TPR) repeat protein